MGQAMESRPNEGDTDVEMLQGFSGEIMRAARDEATKAELARVLRRWGGMRVYVPVTPYVRPREVAASLLAEHVPSSEAVNILAARFGLTQRHCRRLVNDAMRKRGQSMSARR